MTQLPLFQAPRVLGEILPDEVGHVVVCIGAFNKGQVIATLSAQMAERWGVDDPAARFVIPWEWVYFAFRPDSAKRRFDGDATGCVLHFVAEFFETLKGRALLNAKGGAAWVM